VLDRINVEITRQIKEGVDLPPPPKTAIAGPEYFGLNIPDTVEMLEALDEDRYCTKYWQGREARAAIIAGVAPERARSGPVGGVAKPRAAAGGGGGGGRGRGARGRRGDDDDEDVGEGVDEDAYTSNKWSGISR